MPITEEEIKLAKAPFHIVVDCSRGPRNGFPKKETPSKVTGFSETDPLGVGGGMFPDYPAVYFERGGWLLLPDLMKYHSIVPEDWSQSVSR